MSVGRPRWTSPSTCSIACWTWDARATSASPDPDGVGGQCDRSLDPCTTLACPSGAPQLFPYVFQFLPGAFLVQERAKAEQAKQAQEKRVKEQRDEERKAEAKREAEAKEAECRVARRSG